MHRKLASMVLFLAGSVALSQAPPPAANNPTGPAAIVNGKEIPEAKVIRALRTIPGWEKMDAKERTEARREITDLLISNELVEQHLVALKVTVDPKDIQARLDELNQDLKKRNMDYAKMLQQFQMSDAEFKEHLTEELRWEKYAASKTNDKELRALFDSNKLMFDGTKVRARHILIAPKPGDAADKAKALATLAAIKVQVATAAETAVTKLPPDADALTKEQARAAAAEDAFSRAAETNSICPTKQVGGDLDWFPRISSLDEKVVVAAFALKPYTMSEPVETQWGQHLIMTTGRQDGQPVAFEKVREAVQEVYVSKMRDSLVAKLRGESKVQVMPTKG